MTEPVRIQKLLADAGVASRRGADALVAAGRVTVNDRPAVIGERVDPIRDRVAVDGRLVGGAATAIHLALHKPAGVTSTVRDRHAEQTVVDLVPPALRRGVPRLYPVGRLDRDSEGLILLTNDGDWANRILHPRYAVEREYAVALPAPLRRDQLDRLAGGIPLEEGLARFLAIRTATTTETGRTESLTGIRTPGATWYRVVLGQGWKRQVRRMLAEVGAPVLRLVRVRIGSLRLDDLAAGRARPLSAAERDRLGGSERRPASSADARPPRSAEAPARAPVRRRQVIVSLDGPAACGKSSVGAAAAAAVGYRFCDTGVLYRAVARLALDEGVDPAGGPALTPLVPRVTLAPDGAGRLARVLIDGQDATERLHDAAVDRVVSAVAADPDVRAALLPVQRALTAGSGIVMAGRDIGTIVLPDADLRLWLEVSVEERAVRRARQRGVAPGSPEGIAIRDDLARRDALDRARPTAPLRIPEGAVVVDADRLDFDRTVAAVVRAIRTAERTGGTR